MSCKAGTKQQVSQLLDALNKGKFDESVEVVVAPTFIHLPHVLDSIDSKFEVAAQNCWTGGQGAYTGEVGPGYQCGPVYAGSRAENLYSSIIQTCIKKIIDWEATKSVTCS